jgi:hypothetical protein
MGLIVIVPASNLSFILGFQGEIRLSVGAELGLYLASFRFAQFNVTVAEKADITSRMKRRGRRNKGAERQCRPGRPSESDGCVYLPGRGLVSHGEHIVGDEHT